MKKAPVLLVIILIVLAASLWVDFKPKNTNAVTFSDEPVYTQKKHPLKYAQFESQDTNRDGIVTKNEMVADLVKNHEYKKDAKDIHDYKNKSQELESDHNTKMAFVKSLKGSDRKLIEGLSFKEAKMAIHLPDSIKARALSLDLREKALYLKFQIEMRDQS